MKAGREEVFDIFRKWHSDNALVRVQGSFALFSFGLWGFIVSVQFHEIVILNVENETDCKTEFTLRFDRDVEFGYGDNRIVTGDEKRFSECIIVKFSEKDMIALAALMAS